MSRFIFKIEAFCGANLEDLIVEAEELSRRLGGVYLSFDFNGVTLLVKEGSKVEDIISTYEDILESYKLFFRIS